MNQQREKTWATEKTFFQEGGLDFFQFSGGIDLKVGGCLTFIFRGEITLCREGQVFSGGLRGVLPTMFKNIEYTIDSVNQRSRLLYTTVANS